VAQLGIEKILQAESRKIGKPLFERYLVLKDVLLGDEGVYEQWASGFPKGNNHGPSHIKRVLEHLDQLVGPNPIKVKAIEPYELFLTMMGVLYHDVGILGGRSRHADRSGDYLFKQESGNTYIFNPRDREILRAAVVSHSSSKDIEDECRQFQAVEIIANYRVRPRMIAALVRLADELDEDSRRADPIIERRIDVSDDSKFYWRFSQRILGIQPDRKTLVINVNIDFQPEDVGKVMVVDKEARSFLFHFAQKLAKINRERADMIAFLPPELQYGEIKISVRPLPRHRTWKTPRRFSFYRETTASEFMAQFPELLQQPARIKLLKSLDSIRLGQYDKALSLLNESEALAADLPPDMVLQIYFDQACLHSLRAQNISDASQDVSAEADRAMAYLKQWIDLGLKTAWSQTGMTPENEIFRMGNDPDLLFLLLKKKHAISLLIPEKFRTALPSEPPVQRTSGGGGCIPCNFPINGPTGLVNVECLRPGQTVLSLFKYPNPHISTTVVRKVHARRASEVILINDSIHVTPTQPLLTVEGVWIDAERLEPGSILMGETLLPLRVDTLSRKRGYFEVFTITTDHPSHNFLSQGVVCKNKYPASMLDKP
jgi:hypothetical protein